MARLSWLLLHGDRTSGPEEIKRFPSVHLNNSVFYPYGQKGLTNEGKRHAYNVGEYLRKRYDGFLSELYLPEEISIRTTDFARTKMTVLAALAGLYPPNRQQKWNYYLNWQPIPYDTRTVTEDDLSIYKSCPKYASIKTKVYDIPEVHERIEENREFLKNLSSNAGYEFKGTSDMYFFNNLVHSLENVGVKLPQWVQDAKPKITELTSLEFECEFYTPELKRMGGGVALGEFVEASRAIMSGDSSQPKVHLLSAHENSVAGFMAAAGVFTKPHQPSYGATFSLELRRNVTTSKYGVMCWLIRDGRARRLKMFVRLVCVLAAAAVGAGAQNTNLRRRPSRFRQPNSLDYADESEIKLAFVMFRHGDRTPDPEELDKFPAAHINSSVFYPYGLKALTNLGKKHAYNVGEYLRKRYNGFLSEIYLPEEISIRTTDYARTKMTVLAALAGLYPPSRIQRWNYFLNWQPIPYDTRNFKEDDLQVYRSCPKYEVMKNSVYDLPEVKIRVDENREFMDALSEHTGRRMNTPTDVFFLSNLAQCLENVGLELPQWVKDARPKIKEMANLEFECEFYTPELKRLGGGVVLGEFLEASRAIMSGDSSQPKVHLLSAHENSVAGFMAAAGVFTKPHQPTYGATFSLELRRNVTTSKYGVLAVYAAQAGGPGVRVPIPNCGEDPLCDFDTFVNLTKEFVISRSEFQAHCY